MELSEKVVRSLQAIPGKSLADAFWYAVFAGAAWVVFRVLFRRAFGPRRISPRQPTRRQISREVLYSMRSIGIFGLVTGGVVFAALSGWTRMYRHVEDRGWTWYFVSLALMILLHDAYFYWTHRAMHHRRLYRLFHRTHHLSTSPTPWAAYSFSPLEALVQAGIGPLIVFTIPVHPSAFLAFMLWQIAFNVLGHCGYEIFPRWFVRSRLGIVLNTPTHHALHHEKFRANFGLYFNVWDRLLGTNHPQYEQRFEAVTSRPSADPPETSLAAG